MPAEPHLAEEVNYADHECAIGGVHADEEAVVHYALPRQERGVRPQRLHQRRVHLALHLQPQIKRHISSATLYVGTDTSPPGENESAHRLDGMQLGFAQGCHKESAEGRRCRAVRMGNPEGLRHYAERGLQI